MDIEWTDADPDSGEKRYVCAEKFARRWRFKVRHHRRAAWDRNIVVSRGMWETLLDALERRYRRREGVSDEDIADVKKVLAGLPEAEQPTSDSPQSHREHRADKDSGSE
jgi:hypothetical protein